MVFSSLTFLFFFLPVVIGLYYLAPRRWRNGVLAAASLAFYIWGAGSLVVLLLGSIVANYGFGLWIERAVDRGGPSSSRLPLAAAVAMNLGMLFVFKYAVFASAQLGRVFGFLGAPPLPVLEIFLPIGISFYTFHALSYLIDIRRGTARHLRSPIDFALYITFFPQLIAGPIVRFHEIRDQLVSRSESVERFAAGVYRFGHGLAKKVLIADTVAPIADAAFAADPSELGTAAAIIGVVAYAVQLYFDFSGYSDMALGLAQMFGIRLPENFDRPYASRSITEFWRRWHMSLSRWFRDYLYIPLGGNRGSPLTTYRNLVVVFVAVGLWHGANWTFLAWGLYHGTLLLVERALGIGRTSSEGPSRLAWARTVVLVLGGWILFRAIGLGAAAGYAAALLRPGVPLPAPMVEALDPLASIALIIGCLSVLIPRDWVTGLRLEREDTRWAWALRGAVGLIALPLALLFTMTTAFSPFLYFQF
ncbi:MAG: MBOAT family protein [Candidatus Limnocylindrales bacterium]